MEIVGEDGTLVRLPLSALKLIGRGSGISTADRTIAKHHASLKAEEAFTQEDDAPPPDKWWEKAPLNSGTGKGEKKLRVWVEVLGPNPICVLLKEANGEGKKVGEQGGGFEVKFLEKGEGCWLVPGDSLSLSILKPCFFTVKKPEKRELAGEEQGAVGFEETKKDLVGKGGKPEGVRGSTVVGKPDADSTGEKQLGSAVSKRKRNQEDEIEPLRTTRGKADTQYLAEREQAENVVGKRKRGKGGEDESEPLRKRGAPGRRTAVEQGENGLQEAGAESPEVAPKKSKGRGGLKEGEAQSGEESNGRRGIDKQMRVAEEDELGGPGREGVSKRQEGGGQSKPEIEEAGPSGSFDPIKEYGLVVEGAEFDQYDQKKANNTRPWTWQIGTSKRGDESDGEEPFDDEEPGTRKSAAREGGKGRAKAAPQKSKGRGKSKVGSDDEDEWTGDSDEEAEKVEEVEKGLRGSRKAPAVATRSHDRPRSRTLVDSDGASDEKGAGRVTQAGGKDKTGGSNEGKADVSKPGARASAAKGAGAKAADSKKRGARKGKKAQGNNSEDESDDDEPTAEDLDFIVDDEEMEAEEEESEDSGEEEWEDDEDEDAPRKSKGKQAAKDTRPMCRYGAKCYRKNPDHLKQFRHP